MQDTALSTPVANPGDAEMAVWPITAARREADRILAKARRDAESYTDTALQAAADTLRNARREADRIVADAKAEAARIRLAARASATPGSSPTPSAAPARPATQAIIQLKSLERLDLSGVSLGDFEPSPLALTPLSGLERLAECVLDGEGATPTVLSRPHHCSYAHFTLFYTDTVVDVIPPLAALRHVLIGDHHQLPHRLPPQKNSGSMARDLLRELLSRQIGDIEAATTEITQHELSPGWLHTWMRQHQSRDHYADFAYRLAVVLFSEDRPAEADPWLRSAYDAGHPGAVDLARHTHPHWAATDISRRLCSRDHADVMTPQLVATRPGVTVC